MLEKIDATGGTSLIVLTLPPRTIGQPSLIPTQGMYGPELLVHQTGFPHRVINIEQSSYFVTFERQSRAN